MLCAIVGKEGEEKYHDDLIEGIENGKNIDCQEFLEKISAKYFFMPKSNLPYFTGNCRLGVVSFALIFAFFAAFFDVAFLEIPLQISMSCAIMNKKGKERKDDEIYAKMVGQKLLGGGGRLL